MVISFEPLIRRRRLVIACFLALTAVTAPGLPRLRIDNSAEGFFPQDHAALQALEDMERDFGRDHGVRLVLEGDGLWTTAGLRWLAELESSLPPSQSRLGGVYAVAGPWRHHRWHLTEWPPADPDAFRRLLLADPVDRNAGWVGPQGKWMSVLVGLFRLSAERRESTLAALAQRLPGDGRDARAAGTMPAPPGISAHLSGLPVVSRELDRGQARIVRTLFPWLVVVAVGLLVALFRSVSGVVLPLTLVAVTQIVLFGLAGYAGQRLDLVTSLLLPLVFVIMLATGVHVLAYHRRSAATGADPARAAEQTYRIKAWPVLWTGATTCIGFGSLAVSPVPSIRALGLWTASGIAFGTLAALSLYPALLATLPTQSEGSGRTAVEEWIGKRCRAWIRAAIARPGRVRLVFGLVALIAALGLPRLAVDTGALAYFAPEHPLRRQIERMQAAGLPPVSASVVLEASAGGPGFDRPDALRRLATLAAELRTEPLVWGAISAGDLVADVARYLPTAEQAERPSPDAVLTAARARMAEVPDLASLLTSVLTDDGQRARVVLFTPMRNQTALAPMYRRVANAARRAFPEARVVVTGQYPLVLTTQRSLLRTVILSLSLTILAIAVIFRLLLHRTGMLIRVLAPNLWPVLLTLGVMGWLGVPLDSSTVMIAAVVLGLAVDDTLHGIGHLRVRFAGAREHEAREALLTEGFTEVAGGQVATSVILSAGFLVPAFSELLPVARFGILSALAIMGALAADLLLVPALLATAPEDEISALAPRSSRE